MITYTKLQNGTYGIKSNQELAIGAPVLVTRRQGASQPETPVQLVWSGPDRFNDGQTAYLYVTERGRRQVAQQAQATTCPHCGKRSDEPVATAAPGLGQNDLPF